MSNILSLEEEAFGLDINDLSLKIVKLKKKRKGFALVSFNEAAIPPNVIDGGVVRDEETLAKIIKSAYSSAKGRRIGTKLVIASLPEEKCFSQVIQMPKMTQEELNTSVPLEAENYIPLPINEAYIDFNVIPPPKDYFDHLDVQIVAVPKIIVDSYISCFKKAGLTPIALESESEAISRALVKKESSASLIVLIDFGENGADFIIFSGKSIRFTCSIPVSSKMLTEAISESLQVDKSKAEEMKIEYGLTGKSAKAEKVAQAMMPILDEFVFQVKKYINFYKDHSSVEYFISGGKVEKILVCGGGSELKGLTDFMSKKLEIPVEYGNPLVNFSIKKPKNKISKSLVSYTTAIGLALRKINTEI